MTRVLAVGLRYPPHQDGGYEVSCRDVMERLTERDHEVAVLTSSLRVPGTVDPPGERDGRIPVWRDLQAWFRDDALYTPAFRTRWAHERANHAALEAALDRFRPDVVSAWQLGALSLGLLRTIARRRLPVVFAVSDDWLSYGPELDAWSGPFRRWPRWLARAAEVPLGVPTVLPDPGSLGPLAFISEDTRRRAERYAPWALGQAPIVYSGIDGRLFTQAGTAEDRPWTGRLLYVGRFDVRKGIETAIRSLVHLPPSVTLEVQGTADPAEQERLAVLVGDLGLDGRVELARCPRSELPARYRAADAFLFPSEWEEPFGLTPLEAMASGTPVIATGVGGSGEFLLDGRNCLRFTSGDPRSLAAAVGRLSGDPALRRRLVDGGRRTARVMDADRLTDCFEGWHAHVIDPTTAAPASRSFTEELERER